MSDFEELMDACEARFARAYDALAAADRALAKIENYEIPPWAKPQPTTPHAVATDMLLDLWSLAPTPEHKGIIEAHLPLGGSGGVLNEELSAIITNLRICGGAEVTLALDEELSAADAEIDELEALVSA